MLYYSLYKWITNTINIIYAFSINVSIELNYFGNIRLKNKKAPVKEAF